MKKIRKISLMVLALVMALQLSACSSGAPSAPSDSAAPSASGDSYLSEDGYDSEYDPYYDYSGGERYSEIEETGWRYADEQPEATFSLKVDTASYSNVKRYIEDWRMPPKDAVRTEELINWFGYDEPLVFEKGSPFAFYTEVGPSPFSKESYLAFVRVGTRPVEKENLPPSNLVFLIDISGSMSSADKLPLLQNAFAMLTETLGEDDVVSIVTYASGTKVALAGASGSETRKINKTIYGLKSGGSTAGGKGIELAYELAEEFFIEGGNNRVILATDGDFNVGISDTKELSRFITKKRDTGVYLSVLGFGTGNIRDDIMETLAKDGNGNYSYIDSRKTAEKVLIDELASNLFTVADDVKAQMVFDPDTVYSYRLIGYENRMLNKKDFDNDRKDAGELGAGSDVIALFEFEPYDTGEGFSSRDHLFDVRIRYKDPGDSRSQLIEFPVTGKALSGRNTTDFGFVSAVAMFGDYLRNGDDYRGGDIYGIISLAEDNLGRDASGYREDFVDLLYTLQEI